MKTYIDESDQVCADIPSACIALWCKKKSITVRFLHCGIEPEKAQVEAAELLAKGTVDYSGIIGKAAIAYWNTSIRRNPRRFEGHAPVKAASDLLGRLRISSVYIHVVVRRGGRVRLGFAGSWDLDEEHGLGVLTQDGAVKEIGHEEVAFTEDDAPSIEHGSDAGAAGESLTRSIRRRHGTIEEHRRSALDGLAMLSESLPRFRKELQKQLAKARKEISGAEARPPREKRLPSTSGKARPAARKATSALERRRGTQGQAGMNDGSYAREPLKPISDEIRAKAIQLQMGLTQATMAGDATRGEQLRREYEALMERMQAEVYGQRTRDPVAVIEGLIEAGSFADVGGEPWRATELCLCDAIYHGECQVVRGPLVVDVMAAQRDDDGKIGLLLLRGKKMSAKKRLQHLGSVAADSGSMLVLDAPIADRRTSEAVKRTIFAAGEGERVRTVAIDERIGWLVSPGFGSGGFDVYAKDALIVIDFLRVRDDPERMRY